MFKCGWRVHTSWDMDKSFFQIKTLKGPHNCGRSFENTKASADFLANKIVDRVVYQPDITIQALEKSVSMDLMANVKKIKAYRAKNITLEQINGVYLEQYALLWDYCNMVRVKNPGSMAVVNVNRDSLDTPQFSKGYLFVLKHV